MIIEAFFLAILVGLIRRGSVKALGNMPLRHVYLFAFACILFPLAFFLAVKSLNVPAGYIRAMNVAQYVFLLAAIAANFHIKEMLITGVGTFFNFLVVAVNSGVMPVSMKALSAVNMNGALGDNPVRHAMMTPQTNLKFLADIIAVPPVCLFGRTLLPPEVASLGDVVIAVGVFLLVMRFMCQKQSAPESPELVCSDAKE